MRRDAGLFDVSHMTVVDVTGGQTRPFLRRLLANDVGRLNEVGQALYGCMLNEHGGVIDDLITYDLGNGAYRLIVNAATRQTDLAWMGEQTAGHDVELAVRDDLAMIAVQGPNACTRLIETLNLPAAEGLRPFRADHYGELFVARTGYTGEDGFELLVPAGQAADLWRRLVAAGVRPCGLGARDSLRLEAGLNLYGQDMDDQTTPLESNLAWTVALQDPDRAFIGRAALERQRQAGVRRQLVGLVLERGAIPRHGALVHTVSGSGRVTSGGFGPTVEKPVALARIPAGRCQRVEVELRGVRRPAWVVQPPFVRKGRVLV